MQPQRRTIALDKPNHFQLPNDVTHLFTPQLLNLTAAVLEMLISSFIPNPNIPDLTGIPITMHSSLSSSCSLALQGTRGVPQHPPYSHALQRLSFPVHPICPWGQRLCLVQHFKAV